MPGQTQAQKPEMNDSEPGGKPVTARVLLASVSTRGTRTRTHPGLSGESTAAPRRRDGESGGQLQPATAPEGNRAGPGRAGGGPYATGGYRRPRPGARWEELVENSQAPAAAAAGRLS